MKKDLCRNKTCLLNIKKNIIKIFWVGPRAYSGDQSGAMGSVRNFHSKKITYC